jgi:putative phage-type endonuclease
MNVLRKEIINILHNTPDIHIIKDYQLTSIVKWIYCTICQYQNHYSYCDVETTVLSCLKKVYYLNTLNGNVTLNITVREDLLDNDCFFEDEIEEAQQSAIDETIYDTLSVTYKNIVDKLNYLLTRPQPAQRSPEWFKTREEMITASDGCNAIDEDKKYNKQFEFILKKCGKGEKFTDNVHTHHGKKYEKIAILIYEKRNNVKLLNFGLLKHKTINFLGASPDSICNILTLVNAFTLLGGRMIEIKCPTTREILFKGPIDGVICPHQYWVQIQLQLECCDLDECDFWQCKIEEYDDKREFLNDCDPMNPYISKKKQLERGAIVQFLPKNSDNEFDAKFIYPPHITMTPEELDGWIKSVQVCFLKSKAAKQYKIDKIIWWKLAVDNCTLIKRDKEWFEQKLPKLKDVWTYVEFFRKNPEKLEVWCKYIDTRKKKMNVDIMNVATKLKNDNRRGNNYTRLKEELDKIDMALFPKKCPRIISTKLLDKDVLKMVESDSDDD